MKLLRVGIKGKEKPAVLDENSKIRDISSYIKDLNPDYLNFEMLSKLKNLDLWIVGLLRYDPHPSHAGFDQILDYINYLKPKRTLFTHMTALLDQEDLLSKCPENVEPAYDGLEITL